MRTIKKILPLFALFCFLGSILSSCDDDCGCDPKIDYIISSNQLSPSDSIIVASNSGSYIIIVGENLASVVDVRFGDISADLNPAFITDNSIIIQIPSNVEKTTTNLTITTAQGRKLVYAFTVDIPPPVVEMFYSEFVPAGGTLRIKGQYFFSPKVYFYGEDGSLIQAPKVEVSGSTEIKATVPEGVTHSMPVVVENGSGRRESSILFRDKRNTIINFDDKQGNNSTTLDSQTGDWKPEFEAYGEMFELPEGCDGFYGQINKVGYTLEGGYIAYSIAEVLNRPKENLLGPYENDKLSDLVLKFEVYVPEKYAINGVFANIYIVPEGAVMGEGLGRDLTKERNDRCVPGAFWHPFELKIDKTNPTEWKDDGSLKDFYTDGWMTVSVPLSTFKWNISLMGPYHMMQENFGDPSALAYKTQLDPSKCWEFAFTWSPENNNQSGTFFACFDNFRIVPDDGGGALFGKVGQIERSY